MKNIFSYRVVNHDLEVAKRTFDLVITGLYPEEILNQNTSELIASTPRLNEPASRFGKLFTLAAVTGVVAVAAFLYLKKRK